MKRQIVTFFALMLALPVLADWRVDPENSFVGFASVKNEIIPENHSFTDISGLVSASGEANIVIALASVETIIPIRNERMRTMLFDVATHPNATVTSNLPIGNFTAMTIGDSRQETISLKIDLHGLQLTRGVPVKVTRSGAETYDVTSLGPIMLHASQFALADGVEALRKIAGLQSIELMVPVTFDLRLVKAAESL